MLGIFIVKIQGIYTVMLQSSRSDNNGEPGLLNLLFIHTPSYVLGL